MEFSWEHEVCIAEHLLRGLWEEDQMVEER